MNKYVSYTSLESKLVTESKALKNKINSIIKLDFKKQKEKFVTDIDFIGWNWENIQYAEILYKNYLFLIAKYRESEPHLPPSTDIDDFWHGHILDTQRYTDDCVRIFGTMIHHNPFFGYGTTEAEKLLSASFERTQELYTYEFGAPIFEVRERLNT
jgi:hypothetical protein